MYLLPSPSLGEQANFKPDLQSDQLLRALRRPGSERLHGPQGVLCPLSDRAGFGDHHHDDVDEYRLEWELWYDGHAPAAPTTSTTTGVRSAVSLATTAREHVSGSGQHRPTRRTAGGSCGRGSRFSSPERSADDSSFGVADEHLGAQTRDVEASS